jgi:hypothetical protein
VKWDRVAQLTSQWYLRWKAGTGGATTGRSPASTPLAFPVALERVEKVPLAM